MSDAEKVLELVLVQARGSLDSQLRASDALDSKVLGILGADAAALGVVIAIHDAISPLWWLPALGLAIAAFVLFAAVWPRKLDDGPDWRIFYETYGGGSARDVAGRILDALLDTIDRNTTVSRKVHGKDALFRLGFGLMMTALVGTGIAGYVR